MEHRAKMKVPPENHGKRTGWVTAIIIALAIVSLYLFISTRTTLWDRDEPRYARVTVEMVESGNYLVPTFNGESWLDKPVFMYWLMSLPVRIFGPAEFACRFFSAIGIAVTCLLTFLIGRQLFSVKAGLWSMVILASSFMILTAGTSAIADALLLPFIVAVMMFFIKAANTGLHVSDIFLMGIALGLAMLTKGPIGFMPVPVIISVLWLNRKSGINVKEMLLKVGASV